MKIKIVMIFLSAVAFLLLFSACLRRQSASDAGKSLTETNEAESSKPTGTVDPDILYEQKMDREQYERRLSHQNPKTNEEVREYGYDEDGKLVLPLSALKHCEDFMSQGLRGTTLPPQPISTRFDKDSGIYNTYGYHMIEITGYVTDLTSYCTRSMDYYKDIPGLPKQWNVSRDGYTETKIMITGVISVGNHLQGEEHDYSCLIGKEVTVRQQPYWYYNDDGELSKDAFYYRYTYVLKPNMEAVIVISCGSKDFGVNDCKNGDDIYDILTSSQYPAYVYDFYPSVNKAGEKITNAAMLEQYYIALDEEYGGVYDPFGKKNAVKEEMAL